MPSISIVLVVVIAAIGQLQLHFVNGTLPPAGSLYNCGETNSAADVLGTPWTYEFHCKEGDKCVFGTCMNCPAPMVSPADAVYCSIAPAVVKRCKVGSCEENFNLNQYCGYAFTKKTDGKTYYFNCESGADCREGSVCKDGSKPIITRCNKANLEVKGGKCRGTDEVCKDTECQKMDYQNQPQK